MKAQYTEIAGGCVSVTGSCCVWTLQLGWGKQFPEPSSPRRVLHWAFLTEGTAHCVVVLCCGLQSSPRKREEPELPDDRSIEPLDGSGLKRISSLLWYRFCRRPGCSWPGAGCAHTPAQERAAQAVPAVHLCRNAMEQHLPDQNPLADTTMGAWNFFPSREFLG